MPDPLLLTLNLAWAALAIAFLTAAGRLYRHREQLPAPRPGGCLPALSIIIPARDEAANIGECLQCITRVEYPEGELEVIVVDDHSTDATALIVHEHAARHPRIRLIASESLSAGWMGKSHACHQGARAARGDWLLFIDADTFLGPHALRAALGYAVERRLGFLSVSPFQRIVSPAERIALPGIFLRFASAIDFRRVNDPDDPFAIANGQFLLFSRDAYARIGGHEAIREEVSDDLAFARAVKRHGIPARTVFGEEYMETRMYRSLREVWHGFSKNALEIMHATSTGRIVGDAMFSFGLALGGLLPLVIFLGEKRVDSPVWDASAFVCILTLATLALFFALALRAMRVPVVYLAAVPFGLVLHGAIILNAWFRRSTGSRRWKGREY